MKPQITSVSAQQHPTTTNGTDGKIVLSGLVAGVIYGVSYNKDGQPAGAQLKADENGNVTLEGLTAGTYDSFSVKDLGVEGQEGSGEQSEVFAETIALNEPAVEAKNEPAAEAAPVNEMQRILNSYFATAHGGSTPRQSVLDYGDKLVKDLYILEGTLPVTKQILEQVLPGLVQQVKQTSQFFLDKLEVKA